MELIKLLVWQRSVWYNKEGQFIMLSMEQCKIIEDQLSKDNATEFVKTLINQYAGSVEAVGELLNYIPKLAERQLEMKQKRVNQYSWAMDLLIGDRYTHPGKYNKNDAHGRFVTLLYTCKAHFTNGNAEHSSAAGKSFFNEFIELLKKKKEFDYTSEKDWEWIYTTAGGADWLESVIRQNIDNSFEKPKNSKVTFKTYKEIW